MRPRARRARAALRDRRKWSLGVLVAADLLSSGSTRNVLVAMQRSDRLRPAQRRLASSIIAGELVRRLCDMQMTSYAWGVPDPDLSNKDVAPGGTWGHE